MNSSVFRLIFFPCAAAYISHSVMVLFGILRMYFILFVLTKLTHARIVA